MNTSIKGRIEQLEAEQRFDDWIAEQRLLESFTDEQLNDLMMYGRLPDPLPESLPVGKSQFDQLDRKTLIKQWREHEREWAGRSEEELTFYISHGHWPDESCDRECKEVR
jgi:hypothetical protein